MTETTEREPRVSAARKKLKPIPSWQLLFESYTPQETPWPDLAVPIILLGQGIIWAEGGTPDPGILCQLLHQTNTGIEIEVEDSDNAWNSLVSSLYGLAWRDTNSLQYAFTAAASMLADVERKAVLGNEVNNVVVESSNAMLGELNVTDDSITDTGDSHDHAPAAEDPGDQQ